MNIPILFFHGTPGNDNQAYIFRPFSFTKIITWERGKPQPYDGPAHLLALSGGGAYALEYARLHPDKARSLTLWSALTEPGKGDFFPGPVTRILLNLMGRRALRKRPEWIWRKWLKANAVNQYVYDQAVNDQRSQDMFWNLLKSLIPLRMTSQLKNEINYLKNYEYRHQPLNLPTYIVHDETDVNVPISNAINIQKHLTNVTKFTRLNSTGHLCFFGNEAQYVLKDWSGWILGHSP